jgi:hypothetical protein
MGELKCIRSNEIGMLIPHLSRPCDAGDGSLRNCKGIATQLHELFRTLDMLKQLKYSAKVQRCIFAE